MTEVQAAYLRLRRMGSSPREACDKLSRKFDIPWLTVRSIVAPAEKRHQKALSRDRVQCSD